ncbi:MAG: aminoacyl-tRNA hydrolase [Treponema sp.]
MISLIAFLGNIGAEYAQTRHNAAWIVAERAAFCSGVVWQRKFRGQYAKLTHSSSGKNTTVHIVKPETYMNLSGECVGEAAAFFKIPPEEILIVHDELELPLAALSLKWSGGLGGHNGLRSIKAVLGTADFWRLRIGIGRPAPKNAVVQPNIADYVLSVFPKADMEKINAVTPLLATFFSALLYEQTEPKKLLPVWKKILPP